MKDTGQLLLLQRPTELVVCVIYDCLHFFVTSFDLFCTPLCKTVGCSIYLWNSFINAETEAIYSVTWVLGKT